MLCVQGCESRYRVKVELQLCGNESVAFNDVRDCDSAGSAIFAGIDSIFQLYGIECESSAQCFWFKDGDDLRIQVITKDEYVSVVLMDWGTTTQTEKSVEVQNALIDFKNRNE